MFAKIKQKLSEIKQKISGFKIYIVAFFLALPDILDGLGIVDWTTIFPDKLGAKVATMLTIARVVAAVTMNKMKKDIKKDIKDEVEKDK